MHGVKSKKTPSDHCTLETYWVRVCVLHNVVLCRVCVLHNVVLCRVCVLHNVCPIKCVFNTMCVFYAVCVLHNVCSMQSVCSTQCVFYTECVFNTMCVFYAASLSTVCVLHSMFYGVCFNSVFLCSVCSAQCVCT